MTDSSNDISNNGSLAQFNELFGAPPVLPDSENAEAYQRMLHSFLECFQPKDFFETVLMKDVTDATWEAARYARHKSLMLHRKYRERREFEAKVACKKAEHGPATELDHNLGLEIAILHLEKLAKLEAQALAKRDRALGQLERYREGLGRSLRMVSDNFIDDQAKTATPYADVNGRNAQSDANSEGAADPALVPAQ
jgi:hypothetical protein